MLKEMDGLWRMWKFEKDLHFLACIFSGLEHSCFLLEFQISDCYSHMTVLRGGSLVVNCHSHSFPFRIRIKLYFKYLKK